MSKKASSTYVLRQMAVDRLKKSVTSNTGNYGDDTAWVELELEANDFLQTGLPALPELLQPNDESKCDFENSVRLHTSLRQMSRVQASDERLWVYLTHIKYWKYMRARWDVNEAQTRTSDKSDYIRSRYFIKGNGPRGLLRNGVARLWWIAELTHDASRENGYELTRIALQSLDITQQLLERNYGRIGQLAQTFLEFVESNRENCLDNGNTGRHNVRMLAKALNMLGGVCLLDEMRKSDYRDFLSTNLEQLV